MCSCDDHEPQGQHRRGRDRRQLQCEQGIGVLKPLAEHGRYDLIFDVGSQLLRIQCKWGSMIGEARVGPGPHGLPRVTRRGAMFSARTRRRDRCAWRLLRRSRRDLPRTDRTGRRSEAAVISGSVRPETASVPDYILAADHRLSGAVAQLGERRSGTPKATGSSPVSSTHFRARVTYGRRPRVPQPLRLVHGAHRGGRGVPRHPPRQALRAPRPRARPAPDRRLARAGATGSARSAPPPRAPAPAAGPPPAPRSGGA